MPLAPNAVGSRQSTAIVMRAVLVQRAD
jgi:hypothetical protein